MDDLVFSPIELLSENEIEEIEQAAKEEVRKGTDPSELSDVYIVALNPEDYDTGYDIPMDRHIDKISPCPPPKPAPQPPHNDCHCTPTPPHPVHDDHPHHHEPEPPHHEPEPPKPCCKPEPEPPHPHDHHMKAPEYGHHHVALPKMNPSEYFGGDHFMAHEDATVYETDDDDDDDDVDYIEYDVVNDTVDQDEELDDVVDLARNDEADAMDVYLDDVEDDDDDDDIIY
jgi:hypothetical protein